MTLQQKLKDFGTALSGITRTYHYRRPQDKKDNWIVWAEQGEAQSFHSDNKKQEQVIDVIVDCFTSKEYDPVLDEIQSLLQKWGAWSLISVQYEDETNLIHYEWDITIAKGGIYGNA